MRPRRALLVLVATLAGMLGIAAPATAAVPQAVTHRVTYDKYSLMIDGKRLVVNSAEFHYFRLPSTDLWRDVLQKEKAAGFNTVSLYFDWAYHSPAPGKYDFTGVRDVDLLLRIAEETGLYVIARPGPYINAEASGGGFPAWLKLVPGLARTSAPGYTEAYHDWLAHLNPIIARHQVTRGGSVLLYNVENEYAVNTDAAYMQDLQNVARAAGIDVPITTNNCCDAADWSSTWGAGPGAVQIPGVDDYPQGFDCANAATVWGPSGTGVTERVRDDAPVFAAEYQAGAIDVNNAGYEACRELTGPAYTRYFQKNNLIASGATMLNYYMGFGGTNNGWVGQPNDVYTSYDYGAAITEGRQLTAKYDEFKRQNYFLQDATALTKTDPAPAPPVGDPALETAARVNPDTGTGFVLLRNTSTATVDSTITLAGQVLPVRLPGHDAKILVTGYDLGEQRLLRSTSEIMTHVAIGGEDIAVLYGASGTPGTSALAYSSAPRVTVLEGKVRSAYAAGELRLDYVHTGLARVLITGGGRRPLLLLLGTPETTASFWRAGPVLVRGTSLLRSADVSAAAGSTDGVSAGGGSAGGGSAGGGSAGGGSADSGAWPSGRREDPGHPPGQTAALQADTAAAGPIEVFTTAGSVTVNGRPVATRTTPSGSLLGSLPGPRAVTLPALTGWRQHTEAPEAAPRFDDSGWTTADKTTSLSPFQPITQPVLFSDEYGFHTGSVWYRGHFTATGAEQTVSLNAITGRRGDYLVWLNGHYLGAAAGGVEADSEVPRNPSPGPGEFAVPAGLLTAGQPATLAVLVQNMGHNDDWTVDDNRFRQPRGLVGASIAGPAPGSTTAISWRIQGTAKIDPVRGPLNNGGLYGERAGWSLPGHADRDWPAASWTVQPGVSWLRTGFALGLPDGQDTSVALRFDGTPPAGARAVLYLNGWQIGQYGAAIGPQTDFVMPAGLLHSRGANTLAVAVIAEQPATVATPHLVVLGTQLGGVPVH